MLCPIFNTICVILGLDLSSSHSVSVSTSTEICESTTGSQTPGYLSSTGHIMLVASRELKKPLLPAVDQLGVTTKFSAGVTSRRVFVSC